MKWLSIAILVMVVFAFSPAKSAESADFSFSVGFHDELSPYGTWVNYSSYGNVWRPYGYSGWRPYMDGYWGSTSYGPTWYGNEPYAPYVYHYGNWIYTARYGWVWIPGYDWHAGRVDWSYGGGYIGWRPQFPSGYYYPGSDYNFWVVINSDRFGYNSYRPYALRSTMVRDLFARRVFRTRLDTFDRRDLERVVRRPLRRLDVRERVIRVGDRNVRMFATQNDEIRLRKHVTEVRGTDRRRAVEKDAVMKGKFEDIRSKSSSKGRKFEDSRRSVESTRKSDSKGSSKKIESTRKFDSKDSSKKFESSRKDSKSSRKPSKVERKSHSKPDKVDKHSHDNVRKSSLSTRKSDGDSGKVRKASYSRSKPSKVEKVKHTVQRSRTHDSKAHVSKVKYSGHKAETSKAKKSTKKETTRKPRKNH